MVPPQRKILNYRYATAKYRWCCIVVLFPVSAQNNIFSGPWHTHWFNRASGANDYWRHIQVVMQDCNHRYCQLHSIGEIHLCIHMLKYRMPFYLLTTKINIYYVTLSQYCTVDWNVHLSVLFDRNESNILLSYVKSSCANLTHTRATAEKNKGKQCERDIPMYILKLLPIPTDINILSVYRSCTHPLNNNALYLLYIHLCLFLTYVQIYMCITWFLHKYANEFLLCFIKNSKKKKIIPFK